jgi:hypothetical protein
LPWNKSNHTRSNTEVEEYEPSYMVSRISPYLRADSEVTFTLSFKYVLPRTLKMDASGSVQSLRISGFWVIIVSTCSFHDLWVLGIEVVALVVLAVDVFSAAAFTLVSIYIEDDVKCEQRNMFIYLYHLTNFCLGIQVNIWCNWLNI